LDPLRLQVLADALEDAGCTDADVLGHLRGPGVHVRGCWLRFVDCQCSRLDVGAVAVAAGRSPADNSRAVLVKFQPKEVAF
jgi:hypothetical protein